MDGRTTRYLNSTEQTTTSERMTTTNNRSVQEHCSSPTKVLDSKIQLKRATPTTSWPTVGRTADTWMVRSKETTIVYTTAAARTENGIHGNNYTLPLSLALSTFYYFFFFSFISKQLTCWMSFADWLDGGALRSLHCLLHQPASQQPHTLLTCLPHMRATYR